MKKLDPSLRWGYGVLGWGDGVAVGLRGCGWGDGTAAGVTVYGCRNHTVYVTLSVVEGSHTGHLEYQ